jgi:hypothetical protein
MALSAPVGRMPTFRPRSEARGRGLGVTFCAAANVEINESVAMAKSLLGMGVVYGQKLFDE